MLYFIKRALLLLALLFLVQIGGYLLFAKQQLPQVVVQNRMALVIEEPKYVSFSSEQELSDQQSGDITLVLRRTFLFVNPDRSSLDSLPDELYCSYRFDINNTTPFLAMVKYTNLYTSIEADSAYGEDFKSAYLWVLFFWWEVENRNIGQT